MSASSDEKSRALFERARRLIPGGVNSPVRAFRAVGGHPRFMVRGEGCRVSDADGNTMIDYVGSWGPLILGHTHPAVVADISAALADGTTFGAPTAAEVELAAEVCSRFESIDRVRLVNSGTEATMTALRLARAATGRPLLIKFDGCYHGHSDSFLVQAGSGIATLGLPDSPGVPSELASRTVSLPYNDAAAVAGALERHDGEVAAVIVEPVAGNMGVVPPDPGFLEELRSLTARHGALLIFDEVITGFRLAAGGAQELFGLQPDLTCLGKIIGGGLPVGALGGREALMEQLAPTGQVYQAGTLSGNPLAVAAGLATLRVLAAESPYGLLERRTQRLAAGLRDAAAARGETIQVQQVGSMLTLFFNPEPVTDFASASRSDGERFAAFFGALLEEGVYIAPSPFETCFVSTAHTDDVIEETIAAAGRALARIH